MPGENGVGVDVMLNKKNGVCSGASENLERVFSSMSNPEFCGEGTGKNLNSAKSDFSGFGQGTKNGLKLSLSMEGS